MSLEAIGNKALVEIARMAYGSGAVFEGENGGRGNLGAIRRPDGTLRVIKFDTHGDQGSNDPGAKLRAANELRTQLISIAMNKGLDTKVLNEIRAKLKLPLDSNDTKDIADPLSRKTVAAVAKIIDKDIWVKVAQDFDMSSLSSKRVSDMGYDDVVVRISESDTAATGVSNGIKDSKFVARLRKAFDGQVNWLKAKYRLCYAKDLYPDTVNELNKRFDEYSVKLLEDQKQALGVDICKFVKMLITKVFQDEKMEEAFRKRLVELADIHDKKKETVDFFIEVGKELYDGFSLEPPLNVTGYGTSKESIVEICENLDRRLNACFNKIQNRWRAQKMDFGERETGRSYQAFFACLRICNSEFDNYVKSLHRKELYDANNLLIEKLLDITDEANAIKDSFDDLKESDPDEKKNETRRSYDEIWPKWEACTRQCAIANALQGTLQMVPETAVVK